MNPSSAYPPAACNSTQIMSPFPHWSTNSLSSNNNILPRRQDVVKYRPYWNEVPDFICYFCRKKMCQSDLYEHFVSVHNMMHGASTIIDMLAKIEKQSSMTLMAKGSDNRSVFMPQIWQHTQFGHGCHGESHPEINGPINKKGSIYSSLQVLTGHQSKSRRIVLVTKGIQTETVGSALGVDKSCQTDDDHEEISNVPDEQEMVFGNNVYDISNQVNIYEVTVEDDVDESKFEADELIVVEEVCELVVTDNNNTALGGEAEEEVIEKKNIQEEKQLVTTITMTAEESTGNNENETAVDDKCKETPIFDNALQSNTAEHFNEALANVEKDTVAEMATSHIVEKKEHLKRTSPALSMTQFLLTRKKAVVKITPLKCSGSRNTCDTNVEDGTTAIINAPAIGRTLTELVPELRTLLRTDFTCEMCNFSSSSGREEKDNNIELGDALSDHLQQQHQLNLLQYYNLFHQPKSWKDACVTRCELCEVHHSVTPSDFDQHLSLSHSMQPSQYAQIFGSHQFHLASRLSCCLCGEKVTHSGPFVERHLTRKHPGVSSEDYFVRLVESLLVKTPEGAPWNDQDNIADEDEKEEEVKEVEEEEVKSDVGRKKRKAVQPQQQQQPPLNSLSLGTSTRPSKLIVHDLPPMEVKVSKTLRIKKKKKVATCKTIKTAEEDEDPKINFFKALDLVKYQLRKKQMKDKKNSSKIVAEQHKCHICDQQIACDDDGKRLSEHIKSHFVSVEYYFNNFISLAAAANGNNGKEQQSPEEDQVMSNSSDIKVAISSLVDSFESGETTRRTLKKNNAKKKGEGFQANGCQYNCTVCGKRFGVQLSMRKHLEMHISKKQIKRSAVRKLLTESRTVTSYHKCLICSAKLIRDYTFLYGHMKGKHRMSIREYQNCYVKKSKQIK